MGGTCDPLVRGWCLAWVTPMEVRAVHLAEVEAYYEGQAEVPVGLHEELGEESRMHVTFGYGVGWRLGVGA